MNNYVYLITDGEYVKIGQSEDPENRLKALQTGNPKPLKIIKKWSVNGRDSVFNRPVINVQLEKNLQSCFTHKKSEGGNEWFKLNEAEIHLLKHIKEFDDSFLGYETKFMTVNKKPIKTVTKDDDLHFLDKTDTDEVDKLAFLLLKSNNTYLDLLSDKCHNYSNCSERETAQKTNHFYSRFINFLKKAQDEELKNILKLLQKENTEYFNHIKAEEYFVIPNQKLKSYYEDLFFLIRVKKDSTYKREIGNLKYASFRSLKSFEKKYYEEGLIETKVIG